MPFFADSSMGDKIDFSSYAGSSNAEARRIRKQLQARGTDVAKNDQDTEGDGDQSVVSSNNAEFYQNLAIKGGDFYYVYFTGLLSTFAHNCVSGRVTDVRKALEEATKRGPAALRSLLETRETSLRLSPILMVATVNKQQEAIVKVAELLLSYGARPDARDVCGKTVCHYGMGAMATDFSIKVCEICIRVHKSQYLFDQKVELIGLKQRSDLNGAIGDCGTYKVSVDRRNVCLCETEEVVAVKPENLRLWKKDDVSHGEIVWPDLYDIPDRRGVTIIQEVTLDNRVDVADILLNRYHARVDIVDCHGHSTAQMVRQMAKSSQVSRMVDKAARQQDRKKRDLNLRTCGNCGVVKDDIQECAACHSIAYCNRDCQSAHWKATHKMECKGLAAKLNQAIVLDSPTSDGSHRLTSSAIRRGKFSASPMFSKPTNVKNGEKFYLKVQRLNSNTPLMLHDESRGCSFDLNPGETGFEEISRALLSESKWEGHVTFIKASFDADGKFTVYPGQTSSSKKW